MIELIVLSYNEVIYRPIEIAKMKRTTTMIIFNEVETKDLCTVRYGLTSNKVLLFCSFEVCRASRPSHFDRQ